MVDKLDAGCARELVASLAGWRHGDARGGLITREFVFEDFAQAFAFMTQIALAAERRDHSG